MNLRERSPQEHLQRSALFGALPPALLTQIVAATRARSYAGGALVFQRGDRPTGLYLVASGKIKEACQSPEGEERIIEVLGPGQTCGEAALFLNCPYPFFVAALEKSELLHIDGQIVNRLIDEQPEFANRLLLALSRRVYDIERDIEAYSLLPPLRRVANMLIELLKKSSANTLDMLDTFNAVDEIRAGVSPDCAIEDSPVRSTTASAQVTLPAAKIVIASRLGISPEALSRAFRDLSDAGLITVHGSRIVIADPQRLQRYWE